MASMSGTLILLLLAVVLALTFAQWKISAWALRKNVEPAPLSEGPAKRRWQISLRMLLIQVTGLAVVAWCFRPDEYSGTVFWPSDYRRLQGTWRGTGADDPYSFEFRRE